MFLGGVRIVQKFIIGNSHPRLSESVGLFVKLNWSSFSWFEIGPWFLDADGFVKSFFIFRSPVNFLPRRTVS